MEENKKTGNILTIILFILLLIAVGVIGYLVGSNSAKENNNNINSTEEKEETSITAVSYIPKCSGYEEKKYMVDIDDNKYENIVEYILDQNDVKAVINYCNVGDDGGPGEQKKQEITESEQMSIFSEMKNSITTIRTGGIGAVCDESLEITYYRNNNQYSIKYLGLSFMSSNDGNIYKILDKNLTNDLEDSNNCLYYASNLSATAQTLLNQFKK